MKIKLLLSLFTLMFIGNLGAQELKIGYLNSDNILLLMPEIKALENELTNLENQIKIQFGEKYDDFNLKNAVLQSESSNMSSTEIHRRQSELLELQKALQGFETQAQSTLANKRIELLRPLYEKVNLAINQVAKENGYTHVFNSRTGGLDILLFAREQDDITNLVLKKL